jgi:hypothetical protein
MKSIIPVITSWSSRPQSRQGSRWRCFDGEQFWPHPGLSRSLSNWWGIANPGSTSPTTGWRWGNKHGLQLTAARVGEILPPRAQILRRWWLTGGRGLGLSGAEVSEVGFIPRFHPISNGLSRISREARELTADSKRGEEDVVQMGPRNSETRARGYDHATAARPGPPVSHTEKRGWRKVMGRIQVRGPSRYSMFFLFFFYFLLSPLFHKFKFKSSFKFKLVTTLSLDYMAHKKFQIWSLFVYTLFLS